MVLPVLETLLGVGVIAVHLAAVVWIVAGERRQPSATVAWLFAVTTLPFFGLLLYGLFGATRARRVAKRCGEISRRVRGVLDSHGVLDRLDVTGAASVDPRTESLVKLGEKIASSPASHGNKAEILIDAAATYASMLAAVEAAVDHVHVEFYIVQPDETGRRLLDVLTAKAKSGVEVRVLVDGVGSYGLPADFFAGLQAAGGHAATFHPVLRLLTLFRRRDRLDFRNHRKIVVVDGKVGFTGGINVGREYLGLDPDVGDWRDTHVRLEGPAVASLQHAFAEDWLRTTEQLLDHERYYPDVPDVGDCIVSVIDSGPDRTWAPIQRFHVQAFALARDRLYLTSPYFVPSLPIQEALVSAALRGVSVKLLVPKHSDNLIVDWAARSYFPELIEAGVKIHEYERGFLHAKTLVVDDWVGSVGSANMDMRSFQLNFELNAFVYGSGFTEQLAAQFEADAKGAPEVDPKRAGLVRRFLSRLARLLSPLM